MNKKFFLITIVLLIVLGVLFYNKDMILKPNDTFKNIKEIFQKLEERKDLKVATLAGGCFWCIEGPLEQTKGVGEVISGYTGGSTENPTYNQVNSGRTGHREAVRVYFDPKQVSFKEILDVYWLRIDPTDPGGQFVDRGEQYKTAIYYHNEEQKKIAQDSKIELENSGNYDKPIVTEILPVSKFYPAEDYHQDFYKDSATKYKIYEKASGRKDYVEKIKEKFSR